MWIVCAGVIGLLIGAALAAWVVRTRMTQRVGDHRNDAWTTTGRTVADVVRDFDWPRYPPTVPSGDAQ